MTMAAVFALAMLSASGHAQRAVRDTSAQSMSGVTDVTGGLQYLLQEDDIAAVSLSEGSGGALTTTVTTFDTSNSDFNLGKSTATGTVSPNGKWSATSYSNAIGVGRVFAIGTDDVGVLSPTAGPAWGWSMQDSATSFSGSQTLTSSFAPHGGVYTQVVMGNFLGNSLSTPLLFYLSNGPTKTEWAMRVLTPNEVKTEEMPLTAGPEFYTSTGPGTAVPQTGSIVAGDFNGDGKDEIALLMDDNQTIVFYSVNPQSLTISQTGKLTLPAAFQGGSGALAASRFRDSTNVELIAAGAGQQSYAIIYSIQIIPNASNTGFTPSVVQTAVRSGYITSGVIATAAPILTPLLPTDQQLILGLKVTGNAFIEIGSFDSNFNYQHQSFSDLSALLTGNPKLLSLEAGNFDNQTGGTHNPATQLMTFTQGTNSGITAVSLFNINASPNSSNWLQGTATYYYATPTNAPLVAAAEVGDLQGRSLRLGAPEVVTIPQQVQPDIVLGLPPMHIDWVTPPVPFDMSRHPGCNTTTKPCVLNLTVLPSVPAPSTGFSTGFDFSTTSNQQGSRKSTTSWSVATKLTLEGSITWGVPLVSSVTVGVKNSTKYVHDKVVANTYNHFTGTRDGVAATTGFADYVFFTEKDMNIYYYPVLGQMVCPNTDADCTQKQPEYVAFSVPDQVTHYSLDGTTLDWYQPVQEPGNVLSYPWNLTQLQTQFVNNAYPVSQNPAPLQGTDSSQTTYTSAWSSGAGQSESSASSNAVSDDFTFSASKKGIFVNGGVQVQLDGGKSWSTLNENTSSLKQSTGIAVNKPAFDSQVASCCLYNFGSYIFGQKNLADPTFQKLTVPDPNGNIADLQLKGPLFVGFVSQVVPNGGNGVSSFFPQAYTLPDVALNHPSRWGWSKSEQKATFHAPRYSLDPTSDFFYWMKGFFITQAGVSTGPNLTEATAGDQLALSARIYNYSLVDTNSPALADPAASIRVRFYGQYLCHSGVSTENSCVGPDNSTCATFTLCGNAFLIGQTQIASIPGVDSASVQGTKPNWVLTPTVNFDTTPYANSYLVYWVVTWMEDANGNLVPEMAGHGLTTNPASLNFAHMDQVPIEAYSNNVGMYGAHSPFFIFPAQTGPGTEQANNGSLRKVTISTGEKLLLDEEAEVTTHVRAEEGPLDSVVLTYYDGDPRKGGKMFDAQRIAHMDPDVTYTHHALFSPQACGVHKLYARAWSDGKPEVISEFTTTVFIRPEEDVDALITSTNGTEMPSELRLHLVNLLKAASDDFEDHRTSEAVEALDNYVRKLSSESGRKIREDLAKRLIGQAEVITGCVCERGDPRDERASATPLAGERK